MMPMRNLDMRGLIPGWWTRGEFLLRNDAVGKFVPPHPGPLPRGEGAGLAALNRTHRLVSECHVIKDTFGSALNGAAPRLAQSELNRSGPGEGEPSPGSLLQLVQVGG